MFHILRAQRGKLKDVHFKLFCGLYLNPVKMPAAECWQKVKARAVADGEEIPGVASFIRCLKRNVTQAEIDAARNPARRHHNHKGENMEGYNEAGAGQTTQVDDGLYTIFRNLYLCGKGYSADYCHNRLHAYLEDGEELPEIGGYVARLAEETGAEVRRNAAFAEE